MKALLALILLSHISITRLHGEGLPLDRETMTVLVEHSIVILSTAQQEEIEVLNTLTLTPEQWMALRAHDPYCPKRFEDIYKPSRTDGVESAAYAIQMSPTSVAIPHDTGLDMTKVITKKHGSQHLHVDRRGQFYCEQRLVPFRKLLEIIQASAAEEKTAMLYVTIPVGLRLDSAVIKTRFDRLSSAANMAGWTIQAEE